MAGTLCDKLCFTLKAFRLFGFNLFRAIVSIAFLLRCCDYVMAEKKSSVKPFLHVIDFIGFYFG